MAAEGGMGTELMPLWKGSIRAAAVLLCGCAGWSHPAVPAGLVSGTTSPSAVTAFNYETYGGADQPLSAEAMPSGVGSAQSATAEAMPVGSAQSAATPVDPCTTLNTSQQAQVLPGSSTPDPVLTALAGSLGNSGALIYAYVHSTIETLPIFDSLKGPLGTVLDGKGTPVDQADLLVSLLAIAGIPAQIEYGNVTKTATELSNWLGLPQTNGTVDPVATKALLVKGNFKNVTVAADGSSATLQWAYVRFTDPKYLQLGTIYVDPATKSYNRIAGYSPKTLLSTAMGYSSASSFAYPIETGNLTHIVSGAIPSVTGLGGVAARNHLASLAGNFVAWVRANQPAASTQQIIGGKTILPPSPQESPYPPSQANFPGTSPVDYTQATLPRSRLLLQVTGSNIATPYVALNSSDIYGHALYVYFNASGTPTLYLDYTPLGTLVTTSGNTSSALVTHDLVCYPPGVGTQSGAAMADWPGPSLSGATAQLSFPYPLGNVAFSIANTWGPVGRGMVERHRRLLATARAESPTATASALYEPLWRSLSMVGFTWANQFARAQEVVDQAAGTLTGEYGTLGVVGLSPLGTTPTFEWTPYFDIGYKGYVVQSLTATGTQPANPVPAEIAVPTLDNALASTLESTVLEQTQPGLQAASMTKLLAQAAQPYSATSNPNGTTVYDLNNNPTNNTTTASNFMASFAPPQGGGLLSQMAPTYASTDLGLYACWVDQATCGSSAVIFHNYRAILPLRGNLSIGSGGYQWPGPYQSGSAAWPFGQTVSNDPGYGGGGLGTFLSGIRDGGAGGTPASPMQTGAGSVASADPGAGSSNTGPGVAGTGVVAGGTPLSVGLDTNSVLTNNATSLDPSQVVAGGGTLGASVDRQAGNFNYRHVGITTGAGGFPFSLSFVASYDSNQYLEGGPLGAGWTHNFVQHAMVDSDTLEALGINSPVSGAAGIVAIYVGVNLLEDGVSVTTGSGASTATAVEMPLTRILETCLVADWFESQVTSDGARIDGLPTGNVVTVAGIDSTEHFVRLPDNSYNHPPQSSASLVLTPGMNNSTPLGYTYTSKTQQVLSFDNTGSLTQWKDPAGALVNIVYSGGQVSTVTNSLGRSLTLGYNTQNPTQVVSVTDDSGRVAHYGYTGNLLTSYVDPNNKTFQYCYNNNQPAVPGLYPANLLTEIIDPATPANPVGARTVPCVGVTSPAGSSPIARATVSYDALGRPTSQTEAPLSTGGTGNTVAYYFAGSRTQIDYTDPASSAKPGFEYYYDPRGNLTVSVDALNNQYTYAYDGLDRLTTLTLPEANSFAYTYDSLNNLLTQTETAPPTTPPSSPPASRTESFTYDLTFNVPNSVTDYGGSQTSMTIDQSTGLVRKVTLPQPDANTPSPVYLYDYDTLGRIAHQTNPPINGTSEVTQYDYTTNPTSNPKGDLAAITVDQGRLNLVTSFGYDATGNMISVTDANGDVTTKIYDPDRRLSQLIPPVASTGQPPIAQPYLETTYAYNDDGTLASQTRSNTSSTGTQPPPPQTTIFAYTPSGLVSSVTDASSDVVNYFYDGLDRVYATQTGPGSDGQYWFSGTQYDLDSRPATLCQGKLPPVSPPLPPPPPTCVFGTPTSTSTYPAIEQRSYTLNGSLFTRQSYVGAPGAVGAAWETVTYAPDVFDRTGAIDYADGTADTFKYNPMDQPVSHTARGGEVTGWTYDALHRMTSMTGAPNRSYGYDAESKLTAVLVAAAAGGVPQGIWSVGYDTAGRRTSDTGTLGKLGYTLDGVGNRTGITWPDLHELTFQYDHLDRLQIVQDPQHLKPTLWTDYYDSFDRLQARTLGSSGWSELDCYDAGGAGLDLISVFDLESTTPNDCYDAGGAGLESTTPNPVVAQSYAYNYDRTHRVTMQTTSGTAVLLHPVMLASAFTVNAVDEVTAGGIPSWQADGFLQNDGALSYSYDSEGAGRLLQASADAGGATDTYQYDPWGRRIGKTANGSTASTTRYLLDDAGVEWGEYNSAGALQRRLVHDPHNTAPVVLLGGATQEDATWLQFDRQGSVVAVSPSDAAPGSAPAANYGYLPYGEVPGGNLVGNPFGFAGYRWDAETTTYHTAARQYNPVLGRFMQTDPIGQAGGANFYAYAGGDPVNHVDPAGLLDGDGGNGNDHEPIALGGGGNGTGNGGGCNCEGGGYGNGAGNNASPARSLAQDKMGLTIALEGDSPLKQFERGEIGLTQVLSAYPGVTEQQISEYTTSPLSLVMLAAYGMYSPAPGIPVNPTGPLGLIYDAAVAAFDSTPSILPQPLFGILSHSEFARLVRAIGPDYHAEESYLGGTYLGTNVNEPGSVRADAAYGEDVAAPDFVVDYKTRQAFMNNLQYDNYKSNLPYGTPIYSINVR